MRSFLIVGGRREERAQKARQMINQWSVDNFDKIVLEEKNVKSIGIDQIRTLKHQLALKPYTSTSKVAVVPEAEKLTIQAQNAILKLLEEPPPQTMIILSSPTTEALLPTIVSRCRIIKLPNKTQIKLDQSTINRQSSIINSILGSRVGERIKAADKIAKNREAAIKFCQAQLVIWRKKLLKGENGKGKGEIVKVIRLIQKTLKMLEANTNPKLALENLFFHLASDDPGSSQVGRTGKTTQE